MTSIDHPPFVFKVKSHTMNLSKTEVDLFVSCCVDQLYPETALNCVKLLKHLGWKVFYNSDQVCCGQTAFNSGYWNEAKEIGEKFLNDFNHKRYIVSPGASCVNYIRNHAKELFFNTGNHLLYNQIKDSIFELSDFLVNVLRVTDLGSVFPHKVTFHDCCTVKREYGISEEPRILLKNVRDLELIEMEHADQCCGYGQNFAYTFEAISTAMTREKVEMALATGAEYICSTEARCLSNIQAYVEKQHLPIRCIHLADILASGLTEI